MIQKILITLFLIALTPMVQAGSFVKAEKDKFILEMVDEHQFDKKELEALFTKVKLLDYVLKAISRPAEKSKEWHEYRKIFITPARIKKGVTFWQDNRELLLAVEKEYGVAREMIVAIIGVETYYGKQSGKYRVIDSLATLAFNYPKRSKFFRNELKQFLLFTRELNMDPLTRMGSYAGAMGMPQFMPSSFQHYAVDFDNDGKINIWDHKPDIFGSVANYFVKHGWQTGKPVAAPAWIKKGSELDAHLEKGLKPSILLSELTASGVQIKRKVEGDPKSSLFAYKQAKSVDHWVLFQNFYTITRYNHSPLYGMAVYQLSEAIKEAYVKEALIK